MQTFYINGLLCLGIIFILTFYKIVAKRSDGRLPNIPLAFLIAFLILKLFVPIFDHFGLRGAADSLDVAASALVWMAAARIVVYLIIDYFLRQKRKMAIPTITRDFGLAVVYIVIVMIVLKQKTSVNLGSLLTTSAILTAVIGFAMQDTLGNLFSGLALQLEHPYQIGDWIGFENMVGKVVGITWKSTKIFTRTEEMIYVPNNTISKATLINYSRPTPRHFIFIEVGTSYNDAPHRVREAVTEVILNHPKALSNPLPSIRVVKYDDFSINYKAVFATEDIENEERTKTEILNDLWYKFRRSGIRIPYPIQEEWRVLPEDIKKEDLKKRERDELEIIDALKDIEMFSNLSLEMRTRLASRMAVLHFAAGEKIVEQGCEPGPMFIIKDGECAIIVTHDSGEKIEVAHLGRMQFFGEMSVLTGAPRTATVKAVRDTICYEIEKKDLEILFKNNAEAMNRVSEVLAERQMSLMQHKAKMEERAKLQAEEQGQILSKIKAFFGL